MNTRLVILNLCALCFLFVISATAEVPTQINFQGTLTDTSGNPITGTRSLQFTIYEDSVGGTFLWSESYPSVEVTDGLFHVRLGSVVPIPVSLCDGSTLWLGIRVSPDVTELSPRQPLVTVPYSYRAVETDHSIYADTSDYANEANHSVFSDTSNYSRVGAPDNDWVISGNTIYSNRRVGISTSSPQAGLDIANSDTTQLQLKGPGNIGANAAGYKLLISFYDNDDTLYTYPIYCEDENHQVDFWLRSRDTGAPGEMTAYFQGRVGIGSGNTSPDANLDVAGSTKLGAGGTNFLEIKQIEGSGMLGFPTVSVPYPTGYNINNTRVLCCETKNPNTGYWYSLGTSNEGAEVRYHMTTTAIVISSPGGTVENWSFRLILMKMP